MKPPSSDAEALRSEQSAPVCATNRLFVTADELGHLASVQQPVRQALRLVRRRLLGDSILDSIRFRIRVLVPHSLLRGSTPVGNPPKSRQGDDQRTGRRTRDGADADVVGKQRAGRPRAGVKDLRSITDPAAGSEARQQEGPEAAHAFPGLPARCPIWKCAPRRSLCCLSATRRGKSTA